MTAPTPGFPPELETAITEALEQHQSVVAALRHAATYRCAGCKEDSGSPIRTTAKAWLRKHQAAVVMEVIAQHTTTEWGVRSEHHIGDYTSPARSEEHADGMLRGYAKYGAQSQKFARLVLPWQEVKA